MKIKVEEESRKLIFLNKPGTQNENDVTTLEIEVPEKYEDFNKKIVFITADGVVWDIIENNTYTMKKAITKYKSVEFYIWLTKGTEDFRSETKTLRLNKNVDANAEMKEEEINGINKLLNEIDKLNKKIDDIEIRETVIDILVEYGLIQLDNLTEEQRQAINNMECTIDENGELNITYDETVLNIDFQVEDGNLIINNNVNATFNINENGELEVSYE